MASRRRLPSLLPFFPHVSWDQQVRIYTASWWSGRPCALGADGSLLYEMSEVYIIAPFMDSSAWFGQRGFVREISPRSASGPTGHMLTVQNIFSVISAEWEFSAHEVISGCRPSVVLKAVIRLQRFLRRKMYERNRWPLIVADAMQIATCYARGAGGFVRRSKIERDVLPPTSVVRLQALGPRRTASLNMPLHN